MRIATNKKTTRKDGYWFPADVSPEVPEEGVT
jgi:hypothetical protein